MWEVAGLEQRFRQRGLREKNDTFHQTLCVSALFISLCASSSSAPPSGSAYVPTMFQEFFTSNSAGDSLVAGAYPPLSPAEEEIVMEALR